MRRTVLTCLVLFFLLMGLTVNKRRMPGAFIADEAVYLMMTQSLAEDGDLRFTLGDLQRVWRDWPNGPEDVILKTPDGGETVYYAKPFLTALPVVPFYLLFGINGFVVFNLLLLLILIALGARYLQREARSEGERDRALLFSATFFLLSAAFPYAFWFHPEVCNMFLVFCGCYFALPPAGRAADARLSGRGSGRAGAGAGGPGLGEPAAAGGKADALLPERRGNPAGAGAGGAGAVVPGRDESAPVGGAAGPAAPARSGGEAPGNPAWRMLLAALCLGLACFVKPISVTFLPLLLAGASFRQGKGRRRLVAALLFLTLLAAAYLGAAKLWSGGWSPYYGNRRSFNHESSYPGLAPAEELWSFSFEGGAEPQNKGWSQWGLLPFDFNWQKFRYNALYYLVGRHTGIFIYFFPSLVCLAGFLAEGNRRDRARLWLLAAILLHALFFLFLLPFNYQGGGGFIGNRYFVFFYPALFFLRRRPPGRGWLIAAWVVAGLFLSQILFTPFGAVTDRPSMQAHVRNPVFRLLPHETTLRFVPGDQEIAQDDYRLRLLDPNVYLEGEQDFWVRGERTARLLIVSPRPLERMIFRVSDPLVEISSRWTRGSRPAEDPQLNPEGSELIRVFEPPRSWVVHPTPYLYNVPYYHYFLSFRSRRGTHPFLDQPGSRDKRYLGCRVEFLGSGIPWENPEFFRASAGEAAVPEAMAAGGEDWAEVELRNDGPATWSSEAEPPVRLAYHWLDGEGRRVIWDGLHTPLPAPLPRGGAARVRMRVIAPAEPGRYRLQIDLLLDGVKWFAEANGAPLREAEVEVF